MQNQLEIENLLDERQEVHEWKSHACLYGTRPEFCKKMWQKNMLKGFYK